MVDKVVYFADFLDVEYLDRELGEGKYIVFDKGKIAKKNTAETAKMYIYVNEIKNELLSTIRNKKIKTLVYLLYGSDVNDVVDNIKTEILPEINKYISLSYVLIDNGEYDTPPKHPVKTIKYIQ